MNGITLLAKKELDLPSLTFNLHINQRYDGIIKKNILVGTFLKTFPFYDKREDILHY